MYISTDDIQVDYHKVDTWPDAAAVAAGYPWPEAATQRIFTIYQSPTLLRDTEQEHLVLTIQREASSGAAFHAGSLASRTSAGLYDALQSVSLNWNPIMGAAQYYIYTLNQYGQNHWTLIDSTTTTTYEDVLSASSQSRRFYRVTANPDAGLADLQR